MKYLMCRMTSQSQVIEGSFKFMSESYSRYVSNLSSLVSLGIVLVEVFSLSRDQARLPY